MRALSLTCSLACLNVNELFNETFHLLENSRLHDWTHKAARRSLSLKPVLSWLVESSRRAKCCPSGAQASLESAHIARPSEGGFTLARSGSFGLARFGRHLGAPRPSFAQPGFPRRKLSRSKWCQPRLQRATRISQPNRGESGIFAAAVIVARHVTARYPDISSAVLRQHRDTVNIIAWSP